MTLVNSEWLESLKAEGTVPTAPPQNTDHTGDEPPCPCCGATAALVDGACPDCGLQLG